MMTLRKSWRRGGGKGQRAKKGQRLRSKREKGRKPQREREMGMIKMRKSQMTLIRRFLDIQLLRLTTV